MIKTVGVIGAGQMGGGIAQVLALADCTVRLLDVNDSQLEKGLAAIGKALDRLIAKGKLDEAGKKMALSHITPVTDYAKLADCQLVIEAATEKIGASESLLIATITLESFMPARCWIAPEMPTAI